MPTPNSVSSSASGVFDRFPPVFIPHHGRDARESGASCFVSEQWAHKQPASSFRTFPDSSRNEPRFSGTSLEGALHQILRIASIERILASTMANRRNQHLIGGECSAGRADSSFGPIRPTTIRRSSGMSGFPLITASRESRQSTGSVSLGVSGLASHRDTDQS